MEDAFAVLCCFIGLAVFRVCWHVIIHRKRQISLEPEDATPPGPRSLLSFLLDLSLWETSDESQSIGWLLAAVVLAAIGVFFFVGGLYIGFHLNHVSLDS
jgi:hypothetical protein